MSTKEIAKKEWHIWIILLIPFIVSIYVWDMVPNQMPIHWNMHGEVDDYGPKWLGLLLMPGINLFTYALIMLAPYIDPKKRIAPFEKPIPAIRFFIAVIFTALHLAIIGKVIYDSFMMNRVVYLIVTLLLLVMGNYMNTLKPNYFIGIRTPWTLENKEIWRKTHRMGAKVWTAGSLILMVLIPLLSEEMMTYTFLGIVLIMALLPTIYSFYLYKIQPENEA
jgi:uncharacterized membrane protein